MVYSICFLYIYFSYFYCINKPTIKSLNTLEQIKYKEGELLKGPEEIKKRWREYIEDQYYNDGKPILEQFNLEEEENIGIDEKVPELIDTEILTAIDELKSGKAEGCDGIPVEI